MIKAHCAEGARLILHLNSVSNGAVLQVSVNGSQALRRELPNKDGKWELNNEYNEDIAVPLPAGTNTIEVVNAGDDWFYLDWVKLEKALPAIRVGSGVPSRALHKGTGNAPSFGCSIRWSIGPTTRPSMRRRRSRADKRLCTPCRAAATRWSGSTRGLAR